MVAARLLVTDMDVLEMIFGFYTAHMCNIMTLPYGLKP